MTDIFTKKKRSEIMSKVRSYDSKIEVDFRKKLWKAGFHYRKNSTKHFGKPDLVLPKYKIVIFIDSCFWHGCKKHGTVPKTRRNFWEAKIDKNRRRDRTVNRYYKKADWNILRIQEHYLPKNTEEFIKKIVMIAQKA